MFYDNYQYCQVSGNKRKQRTIKSSKYENTMRGLPRNSLRCYLNGETSGPGGAAERWMVPWQLSECLLSGPSECTCDMDSDPTANIRMPLKWG